MQGKVMPKKDPQEASKDIQKQGNQASFAGSRKNTAMTPAKKEDIVKTK